MLNKVPIIIFRQQGRTNKMDDLIHNAEEPVPVDAATAEEHDEEESQLSSSGSNDKNPSDIFFTITSPSQ